MRNLFFLLWVTLREIGKLSILGTHGLSNRFGLIYEAFAYFATNLMLTLLDVFHFYLFYFTLLFTIIFMIFYQLLILLYFIV